MTEYERWADLAMAEFERAGRSPRFRVLQDIALGHLARARRKYLQASLYFRHEGG